MATLPIENLLSPDALRRLREFKRDVEIARPGRVNEVRLFGSRARGEARDDSDYDVAVLMSGDTGGFGIIRAVSDAAYDHMLDGCFINPICLPDDYLSHPPGRRTELAAEIARDGIVIA